MSEIVTLTKDILDKYIDIIIVDTVDFVYNNWGTENYYLDLPDKWKLSIALLNNGSIYGFAVNSRKSDIYYIHYLYILKKHRYSKVGESILKACENRAIENNLLTVQLKCDKENSPALKFYFKNGYINTNTSLPGENKYLLEKNLSI